MLEYTFLFLIIFAIPFTNLIKKFFVQLAIEVSTLVSLASPFNDLLIKFLLQQ